MALSPLTRSQWIQAKIEEARKDPVGLWQIVKAGRERYGLEGSDLQQFVCTSVESILAAGAFVVSGDEKLASGWRRSAEYGDEPRIAANRVLVEWLATGKDPDFGGVWFAFPSAF